MYAMVAPVVFFFSELQLAFETGPAAPFGENALVDPPLLEPAAVAAASAIAVASAAPPPIVFALITSSCFV
jgi:hypothetical protein